MKKIFLLLIALSLLGCATSSDRQFALSQTLLTYEKAMRWGDFEVLLNFRESATENDLALINSYKNIRISGYQTKGSLPSDDEFNLIINVEISYFSTNDNRISSVTDRQSWHYNKDAKRWLITSALPEFK